LRTKYLFYHIFKKLGLYFWINPSITSYSLIESSIIPFLENIDTLSELCVYSNKGKSKVDFKPYFVSESNKNVSD